VAVVVAGSLVAGCARRAPLLDPSPKSLAATAPDSFLVAFETSRGRFVVAARRHWSPVGVDRFHYLAKHGFFDGVRFFRVVPGYVAQFGLKGDRVLDSAWTARRIEDDPVRHSNTRGTVAFARGGARTRSTQLFINLVSNPRLDTLAGAGGAPIGFPPIGEVVEGMSVVDSLYSGYGEGAPRGQGPRQDSIRVAGNAYLERGFPKLDYVREARIIREWK
jgi:peptidyl-prolyl cis-trans isomerase A (cyclophilin A)